MTELFHIIKDPVHGSMQFTDQENAWIKPFIDSENFQRLRHIKQLGLADWIFPGAVHTRFSHSIGAAYVACQIANKLNLCAEEKQMVVLASLLHDIGHGPFSHAFEDIFYNKAICHEAWTPKFLEEYSAPVFLERFNTYNKDLLLTPDKITRIEDLIMHRPFSQKWLADIVSSQLDADRLDYLLRDSHFCGVTYGKYDFRWLLHCLTIVEKGGQKHLGITRKGVGVVENYLMARRLMIQNVYQHGKKYGCEFLLQTFLHYLAEGIAKDVRFSALREYDLVQLMQSINVFNQQARDMKVSSAKTMVALVDDFVEKNYDLYKQTCDYDVFLMIRILAGWKYDHPAVTLAKRLQRRQPPKVVVIHEDEVERIRAMIREQSAIQPWQLRVLELPHLSYKMREDPILVEPLRGEPVYLHEQSLIIDALSDKYEHKYLMFIDIGVLHTAPVTTLLRSLER